MLQPSLGERHDLCRKYDFFLLYFFVIYDWLKLGHVIYSCPHDFCRKLYLALFTNEPFNETQPAKLRKKVVWRSVFFSIWHCISNADSTKILLQSYFLAILPGVNGRYFLERI